MTCSSAKRVSVPKVRVCVCAPECVCVCVCSEIEAQAEKRERRRRLRRLRIHLPLSLCAAPSHTHKHTHTHTRTHTHTHTHTHTFFISTAMAAAQGSRRDRRQQSRLQVRTPFFFSRFLPQRVLGRRPRRTLVLKGGYHGTHASVGRRPFISALGTQRRCLCPPHFPR